MITFAQIVIVMAIVDACLFCGWAIYHEVRLDQFAIPVGTEVAFLDRIVRIVAHDRSRWAYEYVFVDDPPPPLVVTPLWDRDHWTHQSAGTLQEARGTHQWNVVRQFNQIAKVSGP